MLKVSGAEREDYQPVAEALLGEEREAWERVRTRLRAEFGENVFMSWFARLDLEGVEQGNVHLTVPTRFLKSWIQAHYLDRVLALFRAERDTVEQIHVSVRSFAPRPALRKARPADATEAGAALDTVPLSVPRQHGEAASALQRETEAFGGSPLDRRMTFASFVVGRSNALAHAAALQIGNGRAGEGPVYNPLYIHAAVGLGKTHLLQAAAHAAEANGRRVLYLTAERFMYSFVTALKSQTAIAFKETLRGIDLLVIDDAQFLQGKSIQSEFGHTLNALIDAGRQVVVAADRAPQELESLDERVRSRLGGGLVVEMGLLDEQIRTRILECRIEAAKTHLPEFEIGPDIVSHLARQLVANGRDLEGAVNRLLAQATLTGQRLDLTTAENAVRDMIRTREPKRVKIEDIQRLVANHFNVSRSDILSSRRTATVVRPRQIAMYLSKMLTLRSLPEIGRRFGGRDHTTVLHAVRKIDELSGHDSTLAGEIEHLRRMLQE